MQRLKQLSNLQIALLLSLGVHAALLTLRVVDPEAFDRILQDTSLEVVLVNASSAEAPTQAQVIAQRNLAGGGDAEQGRATSPLPPAPANQAGDSLDEAQRQIEQMQLQQMQLLAQMKRELARLATTDQARPSAQDQPAARAEEERRRQLLDQLAQIEKRINDENARPKKRYISPATREEIYAVYYDHLRRKIEDRGTRDFPEYQGKKLYGELTMNVTVDAAGRVVEADIVYPSKSRVLDRRAIAIVYAASPFGPFTAAMRKQADQIVVTSRFRFTRDEGLATTPLSALPQAPQ